MHELMAANNGYLKANKVPKPEDDAMTRDEFEEMKDRIEKLKAEKNDG